MIDVRQLQYFVALSAEGTFARAAEHQHITQSALSQQIARLEREVGVQLFERGARGARPTEAGAALLPMAQEVLDGLVAFGARAASIVREARQELRVGSPTYAVRSGARQRTVATFVAEHPSVEIGFDNAWSPRLLDALAEGRLDLSFAMLAPDDRRLELLLVQDEPALLVVPVGHRLAGLPTAGLADLAGEQVLLYPRAVNAWLHAQMAPPLEAVGAVAGELEESSLPAAIDQVRAGRGLFLAVPWEMDFVNPTQLEGLAVVATSGEPGLRYRLWLARRAGEQSGAIDAFWRCAVRAVAG
ncbi:LysR family transcriptional regulator [Nocardioides carbamazepini]|uniref:LysR family transcriptional regulator n=1 Tax=Nocardioides carbamazepini TaxID=2854259 RepID=UPI00214A37BE|nr:LysR family transcriptional regulator [Nocardioides carbamazepini]MCR1786094.1 LysR family transcriptional regulator [Nocardioides carbamazepini]